jgi:hypothetical protein
MLCDQESCPVEAADNGEIFNGYLLRIQRFVWRFEDPVVTFAVCSLLLIVN